MDQLHGYGAGIQPFLYAWAKRWRFNKFANPCQDCSFLLFAEVSKCAVVLPTCVLSFRWPSGAGLGGRDFSEVAFEVKPDDPVSFLDFVHHFKSIDNLTEDCVSTVQVGGGRVGEEHLDASCVPALGPGHTKSSSSVPFAIDFGPELESSIPPTTSVWVSALYHEVTDHPVPGQLVVEAFHRQTHKVGAMERSCLGITLYLHGAFVRHH